MPWSDVRAINELGGLVHSRAVLLDPPPVLAMAEQMGYDTGAGDYIAIVALIITMALLEVVLLAGPAFAVSARRQARTLALMAACGGTPRQARRVVLASGVVLGAVAALLGAVLGVLLGRRAACRSRRRSATPGSGRSTSTGWRWRSWPRSACSAPSSPPSCRPGSRRGRTSSPCSPDVVVTRRPRPAPRSSGWSCSASASRCRSSGPSRGGEFAIALGAIVAVFGMIFIVPLVVAVIARLSRPLPLVMRYAARDAARHRTRTVPAVAAVAATVAGVVALGIANSSDEAQNRESYEPTLAMGAATVGVDADYDFNTNVATVPDDACGPGRRGPRRRGCRTPSPR